MEEVEQEKYRGHTIKIYQDPEPIDPRNGGYQENFGTMVCFHKRYNLGDEGHGFLKNDYEGWSEVESFLIKEQDAAVLLPLYLLDHSGITMNTTGFSCPWDSGRVGVIYATRKNIRDNYEVKRIWKGTLERAKQLLESEVKEYDRYLTGQVYGYRIEDADGEDVDSCWGYNGNPSDLITECKANIDRIIKSESKETIKHYPKIDVFVTKGMQFRVSIRESLTEPTHELTVGSENWANGGGKNHEAKIKEKAGLIIGSLISNYEKYWGGL